MHLQPTDPKQWPHPLLALDSSLDVEGVTESTGCNEDDFNDLATVFLQEQANMKARVEQAARAMNAHRGTPHWPEAVELLRTAAHELTTSFGIVGARRAESFSRHTQLRARKGSALADPPPGDGDLLAAAGALMDAIGRVGELLRQRG